MRDITAEQFDSEVVQASTQRPVVVDFWAPWCGPCHQLSPLLEKVAGRYAEDVDVVKLNVDEAPAIAARYRVQGIPAVKAFRDGKVAGEFVGVQPEPVIDKLFAGLAPSPADRLVAQAAAVDDQAETELLLREALDLERSHAGAIVRLARMLVDRDDANEARELLQRVPTDPGARRLLAELDLGTAGTQDLVALEAAAAAGDVTAALEAGRVHAAAGAYEQALPLLLDAVRHPETRDAARASVLAVFAVLGDDSELTRTWRPRLAAALF